MGFFDRFKSLKPSDPNEFWHRLANKVMLDRSQLQAMSSEQLRSIIDQAQAAYRQGLSAARAGKESVARRFYRHAFTLLPTHVEALDNYGIGLVEEFRFADAIPLFEQSAVAEPSSPLAFIYLVKCYQETDAARESEACAQYLRHHWPDKSPFIDWNHLGKPKQWPRPARPFHEGQVWNYKTRTGDNDSRVWIKLIDEGVEGRPIVHISVTEVHAPDGKRMFLSHLPYDASALKECVTAQANEEQSWDRDDDHFGEGYGMWFEAFNSGNAGVFTAPLNELLDGMLQSIPRNH